MSSSPIRNLLAGQTLSDEERARLLRATRRLRDHALEGRHDQPLKGRHLAIAGTRAGAGRADPFEAAALRLGARVSHIGPRALAPVAVPERLARMLGSLYDAVDCDALSPDEARWLQRQAAIRSASCVRSWTTTRWHWPFGSKQPRRSCSIQPIIGRSKAIDRRHRSLALSCL